MTLPRRHLRQRRPRGFAFVTAIFVLVILAALAAFVVTLVANASTGSMLAIQGARAYQAAAAGLEWARYRLRDPNGTITPGATALPDCFSATTLALPGDLAGFTLQLSCTRYPAIGASPNFHEEGARRSAYFVVVATASQGTTGTGDYVERRLEARIEVCKDPNGSAPAYGC